MRNIRSLDLTGLKIDALLVSDLLNVRYLSGFTGSNGILLLTSQGAVLYTDPRYTIQAAAEVGCKVKTCKESAWAEAVKDARKGGHRRIGFERQHIRYLSWKELKRQLGKHRRAVPVGPVIEQMRTVKTNDEIDLIRRSVIANSEAFDDALRRFKPQVTEAELAAEVEYQQRRHGAEKPSFETIVASGAHSALPHAQPRDRAIGTGKLLLIDCGASLSGYASDMTRTLYVGRPVQRAKRMYSAVLEAQLAAIDAVRAGVTGGAVDRAARKALMRHGMGDLFVHSTGHGLGLHIHEAPRIGRKDDTILRAGMVVTIEPGAYIEGYGGVRIEDTVLVTENGCEVLTPTPKDFTAI